MKKVRQLGRKCPRGCAWVFALVWAGVMLGLTPVARAADAETESSKLQTFTDVQGRSLQGVLMNVVGDVVFLKRADGQAFKIQINMFSKEDQVFIRKWAIAQLTQQGETVIQITPSADRSHDTVDGTAGDRNVTTWQEGYKLKLENKSTMDFSKMRVSYILFKLHVAAGAAKATEGTLERKNGSATMDLLKAGDEQTFDTDQMAMSQTALKQNYLWASGGARLDTDHMAAVWVRIYDADGNLLQEWCSSPEIMKKEVWSNGKGGKGGGGNRGADQGGGTTKKQNGAG